MVILDIAGIIVIFLFALVDFLRGAIRVIGGIFALLVATGLAYFFYGDIAPLISEQWPLDIRISYILGGLVIFLLTYLPGLFIFPLLIKITLKKLNRIEDMALQESGKSKKTDKGKNAQKKPEPPKKDNSTDKEIEDTAEEIQLSFLQRLLGGIIGIGKGTLVVSLVFFMANFLPTPDTIKDKFNESFFGKVYTFYVAKALEEQSPEFKILNNMGYLIEIGQKIQKNPKKLEDLKSYKSLQTIQHLKPVQDFIKDEEFMEWAREHPLKAIQDPKVKKLLANPEIRKALADIDVRKIRNQMRGQ